MKKYEELEPFGNSNIVNKCINNSYVFLWRNAYEFSNEICQKNQGMDENRQTKSGSFTPENSEERYLVQIIE